MESLILEKVESILDDVSVHDANIKGTIVEIIEYDSMYLVRLKLISNNMDQISNILNIRKDDPIIEFEIVVPVTKYADLPDDVIVHEIMHNMTAGDILKLCTANKRMNVLCNDKFWYNILKSRYRNEYIYYNNMSEDDKRIVSTKEFIRDIEGINDVCTSLLNTSYSESDLVRLNMKCYLPEKILNKLSREDFRDYFEKNNKPTYEVIGKRLWIDNRRSLKLGYITKVMRPGVIRTRAYTGDSYKAGGNNYFKRYEDVGYDDYGNAIFKYYKVKKLRNGDYIKDDRSKWEVSLERWWVST
uniref:F-box-like family protein n=1 Tax=Pithovirus LCPAC101 TaxID=2506586 RepID=A0A481Z2E1_9VIRU|nr:MAG: F-box-like family protein [Pithovirus LCPAC101]